MDGPQRKPVVTDAHAHLYNWRENTYSFLEKADPVLEALLGDYASLPRVFTLQDYLRLNAEVEVAGIVWHEFISTDAVREVQWAQRLAGSAPVPIAIVGLVDFLSPELDRALEVYESCPNVTGVRQHMGWDPTNSNRRFAARGDLLRDPAWQRGLRRLQGRRFRCSLEVFSPQLAELLPVVEALPEIGFALGLMGWPADASEETSVAWRRDLGRLAAYANVQIIVSGFETVFGSRWTVAKVQPWVDTVFEIFGTERVMVGSHSPIATLAANFASPYDGCLALTAGLSAQERHAVLHANAQAWFFAG